MDWLKVAKDFGLPGIIGLLIGLGLVTWVDPKTAGGTAILLAVPVCVCVAVGGAVALFRKKPG